MRACSETSENFLSMFIPTHNPVHKVAVLFIWMSLELVR